MNNQQQPQFQVNPVLTQLENATKKYNGARSTLIGVVLFTVINVVLAFTGSDSYFLFSALIPLILTYSGLFVVALAIIAAYFVFWLLSKKSSGWLVAALILFTLDSVMLFVYFDISSMILDIIFHVIVIVSLISGIANFGKMKKLSAQYAQQQAMAQQFAAQQAELAQQEQSAQIEQTVEQVQPAADDAQNGTL